MRKLLDNKICQKPYTLHNELEKVEKTCEEYCYELQFLLDVTHLQDSYYRRLISKKNITVTFCSA